MSGTVELEFGCVALLFGERSAPESPSTRAADGGEWYAVPDGQRTGQFPHWPALRLVGFDDGAQADRALGDRWPARPAAGAAWIGEAWAEPVRTQVASGSAALTDAADEYLFLALTTPVAGAEPEFHRWYDEEHVRDVVAVRCFRSGRRFRLRPGAGSPPGWGYLALYRFNGSPAQMHRLLQDAAGRGETTSPTAVAPGDGAWIYRRRL